MFQLYFQAKFDIAQYPAYGKQFNKVLIVSKFLIEREHADRLAYLWNFGSKPPFEDTDAIYLNQYDRVPDTYFDVKVSIMDTRKDELCYQRGDPIYAVDAAHLVQKYDLDKEAGRWNDKASIPLYVAQPAKPKPPLKLHREVGMFGWTAENTRGHTLFFAFPNCDIMFATEELAQQARIAFLNSRSESQDVLNEIAELVDNTVRIEFKASL